MLLVLVGFVVFIIFSKGTEAPEIETFTVPIREETDRPTETAPVLPGEGGVGATGCGPKGEAGEPGSLTLAPVRSCLSSDFASPYTGISHHIQSRSTQLCTEKSVIN